MFSEILIVQDIIKYIVLMSLLGVYPEGYYIYEFNGNSLEDIVFYGVNEFNGSYSWKAIYYPGYIEHCELSAEGYNKFKKLSV
ncbi:MAG: hypothetical protein ACP5QK_13225 [Myxococcota bacterium]